MSEMKFSQRPPKEPGIYWYRLVEDSNTHFCHVWLSPVTSLLVAAADGKWKPVEQFSRWWSDEFLREPEAIAACEEKP